MPRDRDLDALRDVLFSARLAIEYVAAGEYEAFAQDTQFQDSVIRRVELIGEAARRASADAHRRWPDLPWREMIDMRNVMIHEYDAVDLRIVWDTVERDLPPLVARLETILSSEAD